MNRKSFHFGALETLLQEHQKKKKARYNISSSQETAMQCWNWKGKVEAGSIGRTLNRGGQESKESLHWCPKDQAEIFCLEDHGE